MLRKIVAICLVVLVSGLVIAQDDAIASGLNNPRGLAFDENGVLYIAEGGMGGDMPIDTPEGPGTFGMTSQLTIVTPEGQQVLLSHYPSSAGSGINAVAITDDALWLVVSAGPPNMPLTFSVVEIDRQTMRIRRTVDLFSHELMVNPDGAEVPDSNPVDIAVADDGTVFVVDAGCNCLLSLGSDGALSVVAAWPDNPVPTSIALGADGDLYVGFLSPLPFIPGTARIDHLSADGEVLESFEGLTMVVDLLLADDGTLYAVELAQGLGEQGFVPDSGRVVAVSGDGIDAIAEGLSFPYGIAQSPDGQLVVSINASFAPPGSGAVIAIGTE